MFDFIEHFYRSKRRYSTLDYLSLMEFDVKAWVAETGVNRTRSPNIGMEGEGRTEDIYSLPKDSTNSLESRPATRRKDYTRLATFLIFLQEGSSQTVLHCAHHGSTFRSCDLGEPEEWSGYSPSQACSLPLSPHSTDGITSYYTAKAAEPILNCARRGEFLL